MYVLKVILKYLLFAFLAIQLIVVSIEQKPHNPKLEIKAPPKIMRLFKRSCYDCHSYQTKLPWYRYIAPFSWYIKRHVELGRKWLNFSIWQTYDQKTKDKKLEQIYRAVYRAMPLESYMMIHKNARLTKQEREEIRRWTGKAPF